MLIEYNIYKIRIYLHPNFLRVEHFLMLSLVTKNIFSITIKWNKGKLNNFI
jgi:hypothetical protein